MTTEGVKYPEMARKVAIVTGAGAGTGKAIAWALAEQGCIVVVSGNNYGSCEKVASDLVEAGHIAVPIYCDVSNRSDVQGLISSSFDRFKRVDYLINNAGISEVDFIPKIKEHHWDKIFAVNVKGTFLVTQALANAWKAHGQKGNIVNIVSESAHSPHTMCAAYAASKAAQLQFTKISARELIKDGIRVNAVSPCIIKGTELTQYLNSEFKEFYGWTDEEAQAMYKSKIPYGRLCEVEDVAKATLFLLSNESEFMIGTELLTSGGQAI